MPHHRFVLVVDLQTNKAFKSIHIESKEVWSWNFRQNPNIRHFLAW